MGADLLSFSGAHCRPLPPFKPHQVFVFVAVWNDKFGSDPKHEKVD